jgi:hypothetical protein
MTLVLLVLVVAGGVVSSRQPSDPATTSGPVHHDRTSPAPVAPADAVARLPQGLAPAVPYLLDGELHVDDLTVPTTGNRLMRAGDTVLVGRTDARTGRWWVLQDGALVAAPALDGVRTPVLSPTGDLVAWTAYPDARTTRIVAWLPGTQSEVAHVDLAAPYAECCGGGQLVELLGFDLRDQLYVADRGAFRVWRPGTGGLRRVTGVDAMLEIAPTGPVRQGGTLGRVDPTGHRSPVVDQPTHQGMVWSADGGQVAYAGDDAGGVAFKQAPTDQWVLEPAADLRTHLDVPTGLRAEPVAFESDRWVLVDVTVRPRRHVLLRCGARDGACERSLAAGAPSWVLPERSSS